MAIKKEIVSVHAAVKANVKAQAFMMYPVVNVGSLRLVRSVIPKEENNRVDCHLDLASNLRFTAKALELGLTTDEAMRQLIWAFNS